MILSFIKLWHTWKVHFFLAYPQVPIEHDLYMKFTKVIDTRKINCKTHVLKLIKNLNSHKQAVRLWNIHLTKKLLTIGFEQPSIGEWVFYQNHTIFDWYDDNEIFIVPRKIWIYQVIKDVLLLLLLLIDRSTMSQTHSHSKAGVVGWRKGSKTPIAETM